MLVDGGRTIAITIALIIGRTMDLILVPDLDLDLC
jgi:hypothetical protein